MKPEEISALVKETGRRLRSRGMRRTRALELLLTEMATNRTPRTIAELTASPALQGQCDPATVYRLLMKLEEHGVVRRLGLHDRASWFILLIPGSHHDYLVCTGCGNIAEVDLECPARTLEQRLESSTGYRHVYHELEFYGVCPSCHESREATGTAHCC